MTISHTQGFCLGSWHFCSLGSSTAWAELHTHYGTLISTGRLRLQAGCPSSLYSTLSYLQRAKICSRDQPEPGCNRRSQRKDVREQRAHLGDGGSTFYVGCHHQHLPGLGWVALGAAVHVHSRGPPCPASLTQQTLPWICGCSSDLSPCNCECERYLSHTAYLHRAAKDSIFLHILRL